MCKIASKKLVSRPLATTTPQKPSLLVDPSSPSCPLPLALPLALLTPPPLDITVLPPSASLGTPISNNPSTASCTTNPGYFDLAPRFTPSALLLDSLDYTFPVAPAVLHTPTPVTPTTVISPHHFDHYITSVSPGSESNQLSSGAGSPFQSSSSSDDDEHDYHTWQTQPASLTMEDLLDAKTALRMSREEGDEEAEDKDSSMATSTVAPKKTTSSTCTPARTTSAVVAKTGVAGISKKTVTSEEKRERNRLAAERYRKKGRDTISYLDQQRDELTKQNSDLVLRNEQLEREVAFLRDTLAKHGLMVKGRC